jgi:hypothetical protein
MMTLYIISTIVSTIVSIAYLRFYLFMAHRWLEEALYVSRACKAQTQSPSLSAVRALCTSIRTSSFLESRSHPLMFFVLTACIAGR